MSRVVRFHRTGGPEVLQIDELDLGAPGVGEVRLRVRALGLNRAEAMFRSGAYLEVPILPARLGYEAAGEVEAVGPGVTGFAPGDVVSTIPAFSMNQYGVLWGHGHRSGACGGQASGKSLLLGGGLDLDAVSHGLRRSGPDGGLSAGEAVIITAASSSVGLAAIQIANSLGAVPIATTRTGVKRAALLKAGAAVVVATEEQNLVAEVMGATGNKGARLAFDPVCGPGVEALAAALAEQGTLFLYGALAKGPTPFPLFPALAKNLTLRAYTLFSVTRDPALLEHGNAS